MRANSDPLAATYREGHSTAPTARAARYRVRVVDATGRPAFAVDCHSLTQCHEVVRVEAPVQEPYALFFITEQGRPVERWALGRKGQLQRLAYGRGR